MSLAAIDWLIILVYFIISTSIALYYAKKAGSNTKEFFLSGRSLPWWIAGLTMVATTFAADTPLAITELVAKNGIAGNWLWWNMLFGGMLTVFFFSRLWRRAGIMTDVEFAEMRYSGKPAAFLRGFRALYLGIFMNVIVIGWVNLAMVKILRVLFPDLTFFGLKQASLWMFTFDAHLLWVGVILVVVATYSSLSGLWGVAVTDSFQFIIAMTGTIILAVIAVKMPEIGGIAGLKAKLPEWIFRFTPSIGSSGQSVSGIMQLTLSSFIAYIGIQWWASWYPGAEPGGGGYIAQRMMSAKNEKHSLFATLFFNIAQYCLRPWPWIIVALVSLVLYPNLPPALRGNGFIMVMKRCLPPGLMGMLVAAFLAAYMSTISTQLNWGTSYFLNDFYRRFIRKDAGEKHYILASRIFTIILMIVSLFVTASMTQISGAWKFILQCSAGIGLVLILRWFWWRINAWSEISAMIAPFLLFPFIKNIVPFPVSLFYLVGWSTIIWVTVTFLTPPTDEKKLFSFYRKVHPGGILWKPISDKLPDVKSDTGYAYLFIDWIAGCILVISILFGTGNIIFGRYVPGVIFIVISAAAAGVIYRHLSKIGWEKVVE
ncbi:MAG: Na+:solute symporter [Candidatus Eremiobacteraeota bacterium]|nr:Na+:solute symporter [Candidatus Eremiobacteraeota bacterium]